MAEQPDCQDTPLAESGRAISHRISHPRKRAILADGDQSDELADSLDDDLPDGSAVDRLHTIAHPRKRVFLRAFGETCAIKSAAKLAGIGRRTHYEWLRTDPAYAAAFRMARWYVADNLHDEAVRRAVRGVKKPVFYRGRQCGTIRRYSDMLLIALLKAHDPERFGGQPHRPAPSFIGQQNNAHVRAGNSCMIPNPEYLAEMEKADAEIRRALVEAINGGPLPTRGWQGQAGSGEKKIGAADRSLPGEPRGDGPSGEGVSA